MIKTKKIERYEPLFRSKFMESFLDEINQAMRNITALLKKNRIDFCFIGGAILSKYGYERTTKDIDILIDKKDKSKFNKLENEYYLSNSSGNKHIEWIRPQTEIDIIYSGEYSGSSNGIKYETPNKISHIENNLPILNLSAMIQYKLCAGLYGDRRRRLKDFQDVFELIFTNKLKEDYADDFREDLKQKYIEIWNTK